MMLLLSIVITGLIPILWSPYVIGRPYIFPCCGLFFFLLSFFPRLISAAADWMSAIRQTSNLRRVSFGEEKKEERRRTNHSMKILWSALLHRATITKTETQQWQTGYSPRPPTSTDRNEILRGGWSSDGSSKIRISSKSVKWFQRCGVSKFAHPH